MAFAHKLISSHLGEGKNRFEYLKKDTVKRKIYIKMIPQFWYRE